MGIGNVWCVAARSIPICESQPLMPHSWRFVKWNNLETFLGQFCCDTPCMVEKTPKVGFQAAQKPMLSPPLPTKIPVGERKALRQ